MKPDRTAMIEIPRVQATQTPTDKTIAGDTEKVSESDRVEAVRFDTATPIRDRRHGFDRRQSKQRRPAHLELRQDQDRRQGDGVSFDI